MSKFNPTSSLHSKTSVSVENRISAARQLHNSKCKFTLQQIEWMLTNAGKRFDGEVLVFGMGPDSSIWEKLCEATFVENSAKCYRKQFESAENQGLRAYLVNYSTRVETWAQDIANNVLITLPPEITNRRFDVIIVDGPQGWRNSSPGRTSPILYSRLLARKGGGVFVNDIGRNLERTISELVHGKPDSTITGKTTIGFWQL